MKDTELSSARVSPCVRLFIESLLNRVDTLSSGEICLLFESETELTVRLTIEEDNKLGPDLTRFVDHD